MLKKSLFVMLLWAVAAQGVGLELIVDVVVGGGAGAKEAGGASAKHATVLVIDKSGSMGTLEMTGKGERKTRWQQLQESLAQTMVEDVPIGEMVYLLAFSTTVQTIPLGPNSDELTVKGSVERETVLKKVAALRPDGKTVLFDALGDAYTLAKQLADSGVGATVRVYGDGDNEPPDRVGPWARPYKPKYAGSFPELKVRFQELFAKPGFKQVSKWVSQTPPKDRDIDWETKGRKVFSVTALPWMVTVQRPISAPLALQYEFRLPEKAWADIDGKSAELVLEVNGKPAAQKDPIVVLRKGKVSKTLVLPDDLPKDRDVRAVLRLERMPELPAFTLSPPTPVEIVFAKPGAVALSAVFPAKGTVVKLGDAVVFSAKATDGADVMWRFADGAERRGMRFEQAFAKPGAQSFTVSATKAGLLPAEAGGAFEVVDAGVAVRPLAQPPVVGEPVKFTCEGRGPVVSYEWIVDGVVCAGETAKDGQSGTLGMRFEKSGAHRVQVRAVLRGLLPELSKPLEVHAEPAPFIAVREPEAGAVFDAEQEIHLSADVEGGFSEVAWRISDKAGQVVEEAKAQVADHAAKAVKRLEKGGEYTVKATGTQAGKEVSSADVSFRVRPADLKVSLEKPTEGQRLENGKPQHFEAAVKGKDIEKIKWSMTDADSGKRIWEGESPVRADGRAEIEVPFQPETGDARLEIGAEAVFASGSKNGDQQVAAIPVTVSAFTPGELEIVREESLHGREVAFDEQVKLAAKATGAVRDVRWYAEFAGGRCDELGQGEVKTHKFASEGRERVLADIYAKGVMPDKTEKRTVNMRVTLYAGEKLEIIEPAEGASFEYGKTVPLRARAAGEIKDIRWFADDAEVGRESECASYGVKHTGKPETRVLVYAVGTAPGGRQVKTARRSIVACCPLLNPKVTCADKEGKVHPVYSLDEQLTFTADAGGAAKSFIWAFGDGTVQTNSLRVHKHPYTRYGKFTVAVQAVCGKCGRCEESASLVVPVEEGQIRARFAVDPMKSKYGIGDIVTLKDRSEGRADIQWRIWKTTATFVEGENLKLSHVNDGTNDWWFAESRDDSDVQVKFDKLGRYWIGLEAIGKKAGKRDSAETILVKVWRWWLPWLLSACGLLLWGVIVWLCTGNEPRNWVVRGRVGPDRVPCDDDVLADWRKAGLGDTGKAGRYWSYRRKEAVIPVRKFVDDEDGEQWNANEGQLIVWKSGSKHAVKLVNTTATPCDEATCAPEKHRFKDASAKPHQYLHVWVNERPGSGVHLPAILLSFFAIAGLVGWLCALFAF